MKARLPVLLLTVTLWLLLARPAAAHAELLSAEPPPDAQLAASPDIIRLTFNEQLGPDSTFVLFGAGFHRVEGVHPAIDPTAPEQLVASVPPLEAGLYTVQWTIQSADGHRATGSYSFSVGAAAVQPGKARAWWAGALGLLLLAAILIVLWRRRG